MQKKLLTNGNVFKRTDGRWNGVVWYLDEQGKRKRKSFCGTSKPEVKAKITEYIADFKHQLTAFIVSICQLYLTITIIS